MSLSSLSQALKPGAFMFQHGLGFNWHHPTRTTMPLSSIKTLLMLTLLVEAAGLAVAIM
jgi:hypothetical protein